MIAILALRVFFFCSNQTGEFSVFFDNCTHSSYNTWYCDGHDRFHSKHCGSSASRGKFVSSLILNCFLCCELHHWFLCLSCLKSTEQERRPDPMQIKPHTIFSLKYLWECVLWSFTDSTKYNLQRFKTHCRYVLPLALHFF